MSISDEDIVILAGEYVLGLHDGAGLKGDPRFEAAVLDWTARLMPLTDDIPAVTPPDRLWEAIDAATTPRARLWDSVKFWRGFGLGAGALAAAMALVLALRPAAPEAVATLTTAGEGVFVATEAGGTLTVTPSQASVPVGRTAELWLLAPGAKPQPLGLLAAEHAVALPVAASALAGAQLAISLEPPGGSPTGLPTGPVIAAAKILVL